MVKSKKKPSAAQLRARAKFSKIMKSGGFKKKAKKKVRKTILKKVQSVPVGIKTSMEMKALLNFLKDKSIREITFRK